MKLPFGIEVEFNAYANQQTLGRWKDRLVNIGEAVYKPLEVLYKGYSLARLDRELRARKRDHIREASALLTHLNRVAQPLFMNVFPATTAQSHATINCSYNGFGVKFSIKGPERSTLTHRVQKKGHYEFK